MKRRLFLAAGLMLITALFAVVGSMLLWHPALAAGSEAIKAIDPGVLQWGYVAAALATGLSAAGAGYAVAAVGAAAVGAIAEKPELFGRVLILVGLAEGIAIYGVIMSVLILNRLG
jgi:V/A-type H+/Na+-transporting ATPase subunit K